MKTFLTVALISATSLAPTLAFAAQPMQADFDACNRTAQVAVLSPSASPQASGATGPSITSPSGTPDSTAGVQPGGGAKTGPMITGSGRKPGTTGGVREGTGAVTSGSGAASAPTSGAGASTGASTSGTTGAGSTAGVGDASAAQLTGMSDRGMSDPAYQVAYQDCMKRRGF